MKKKLAFGVLLALVCLYFAFRGLSVRETVEAFHHADPRWILVALVLYFVGYWLRSYRWKILIEPVKELSATSLFAPMILGFFANNVLPFRMGELVRAHITGKKFRISRTASLGTILLERLCDTLSFLTTFVAVALFFPFPHAVEKGAAALGTACVLVILVLIVILRHEERFLALIHRLPIKAGWQDKIRDLLSNFAHGVSGMKRLEHVLGAMALSLVVWVIEGTVLFLIARAFNIGLHYPQSFFLLFFMGLAVTLPQAPGYVGTLELFGVTALSLLGIPKRLGLPVILAIHGTQFLFIVALGLWALGHEGLSLNAIFVKDTDE